MQRNASSANTPMANPNPIPPGAFTEQQKAAIIAEVRHGRYGLDADSCRAGCETMLIVCVAIWIIAILPAAFGYLNMVLFLLNLPILLTAVASTVGLRPEYPTFTTAITGVLCLISFACTIAYTIYTWTYAFLCTVYGSPCPPEPDTIITFTVAAVFGTLLFFFIFVLLIGIYNLWNIYADDDAIRKERPHHKLR